MKAVLMISHGSRYPKTLQEVQETVMRIAAKTRIPIVEYAFLELQPPSIPEGIDRCVARGADDVLVLLNFLNSGRHDDFDIPGIVEESRRKYPGVTLKISGPIGHHEGLIDVFADMIQKAS